MLRPIRVEHFSFKERTKSRANESKLERGIKFVKRNSVNLYRYMSLKKHKAFLFNSYKELKFILLILLFAQSVKSQNTLYSEQNYGISAGIVVHLGSHVNNLGCFFSGYYYHDFIQVNALGKWTFNFKSLGAPGSFKETHLGIGVVGSFGQNDSSGNYFQSLVSSQTGRKYSIGYAFNFYSDSRKTSQNTGMLGVQINQFDISHENDILGSSGSDRFRTAGLLVAYRVDSLRFGINSALWTGNSNSSLAKSVYNTSFARYGYKDLSETSYGKYANGLLSAQLEYAFGYGQMLKINAGIDSERLRNFIQNKVIHDLYFLPEKWAKTKNLHIPMLDTNGNPYLFQKNQEIKKAKAYYQFSLNGADFY